MTRRSLLIAATTVTLLVLAVGVTTAVRPGAETRDVVLTARGMSFYLEGNSSPNPTIQLRAGEHVRFVLRNEATGLLHDLSIPELGLAVEPIQAGSSRAAVVRVPAAPGAFPYICRPHAQMMQGTVVVAGR
jgi:plastocyanin